MDIDTLFQTCAAVAIGLGLFLAILGMLYVLGAMLYNAYWYTKQYLKKRGVIKRRRRHNITVNINYCTNKERK